MEEIDTPRLSALLQMAWWIIAKHALLSPHALSRRLAVRPCAGDLLNRVTLLCALHHDGQLSPVLQPR